MFNLLFLSDGVSGVNVRVQPFVVHVPQDADGLLTLGLALQYSVLGDQSGLGAFLDLEGRGS